MPDKLSDLSEFSLYITSLLAKYCLDTPCTLPEYLCLNCLWIQPEYCSSTGWTSPEYCPSIGWIPPELCPWTLHENCLNSACTQSEQCLNTVQVLAEYLLNYAIEHCMKTVRLLPKYCLNLSEDCVNDVPILPENKLITSLTLYEYSLKFSPNTASILVQYLLPFFWIPLMYWANSGWTHYEYCLKFSPNTASIVVQYLMPPF